MPKQNFARVFVFCSLLFSVPYAHADIIFLFDNNGAFDGTETDDSVMVGGVTMTIRGFEYPDLTGVDGTNTTAGPIITSTEGFQGDGTSFGVNNNTINASNFAAAYGPSNEQNRFNFDEALIFDFDTDVTFDSIDFQGLVAPSESFNVTFGGNSFDFDNSNTNGSDTALNPFGSLIISAGTDIRLSFNSAVGDVAGIQSFEINAVPEPSSILLASTLLGAALIRRKLRKRVLEN
jgi:hypothetical protein